jgi:hypothetical protein
MNANYLRKLVSDDLREVLMFLGLVKEYHCKTKVLDKKGKPEYYSFDTYVGECRVYSSKTIYINNIKCHSLDAARRELYRYV